MTYNGTEGVYVVGGDNTGASGVAGFDMMHYKEPTIVVDIGIPIFIVSMVAEFLYGHFRGLRLYRANDSLNSISHGLIQTIGKVFIKFLILGPYTIVYNNYAIYRFQLDSVVAWILALLAVDFAYYWYHRMAHETSIGWASHATHHSSEEYNFSTALRQSLLSNTVSWFSYLFLALFFSPRLFLVSEEFNLMYQFFIHTEVIDRLGPFEYVFNTPSHHRVHHGRNPKYLDKNYGGALVVWDRLFGTFQQEEEQVVYGLTSPLQTWDPLWGQFHHLVFIFEEMWTMKSWKNKILVPFMPPGWNPEKPPYVPPQCSRATTTKHDASYCSPALGVYVFVHFLINIVFTSAIVAAQKTLPMWMCGLTFVYCVMALEAFGALVEGRAFGVPLELARLTCSVAFIPLLFPTLVPMYDTRWAVLVAAVVASAFWLLSQPNPASVRAIEERLVKKHAPESEPEQQSDKKVD